jgi:hypothetical protein
MGRVPRVPRPPNRRFHAYRQGCALMPKDWSRGQPPLRRCDWQPARRSTPLQSGLSLTTIAATSSRMDRMNDLPSVGWLSESAARDHQILANPRAIRPRSESYAIKWARAIVLATQIGGLLLPALNAYLPCQIAGPMKKKRHNHARAMQDLRSPWKRPEYSSRKIFSRLYSPVRMTGAAFGNERPCVLKEMVQPVQIFLRQAQTFCLARQLPICLGMNCSH